MIRWLIISTCAALLVAGCGQRHRPSVRQTETQPATDIPPSPAAGEPSRFDVDPGEAGDQGGGEMALGDIRLTAPEGWVRKQPRIDFILAEFSLPRVEGDPADGRLTVVVAGGSVQENVARWRGQFGQKPDKQSEETVQIAGVRVTRVDFSGTYNDQRGPFAPPEPRAGYRMLGAIIPVGSQLYFVKAYGPEKTMARHADAFDAFLQSLSLSGSP